MQPHDKQHTEFDFSRPSMPVQKPTIPNQQLNRLSVLRSHLSKKTNPIDRRRNTIKAALLWASFVVFFALSLVANLAYSAEVFYIQCTVDTDINPDSRFVEYGDSTSYNGSAQCQKAEWILLDSGDFGAGESNLLSSLSIEEVELLASATLALFTLAFLLRMLIDFIRNR